jgi:hypothetical protein
VTVFFEKHDADCHFETSAFPPLSRARSSGPR